MGNTKKKTPTQIIWGQLTDPKKQGTNDIFNKINKEREKVIQKEIREIKQININKDK